MSATERQRSAEFIVVVLLPVCRNIGAFASMAMGNIQALREARKVRGARKGGAARDGCLTSQGRILDPPHSCCHRQLTGRSCAAAALPREIPSILQFEMDQTRLGLRRPGAGPPSVCVPALGEKR